jgi:hypothetical protein
LLLTESEQRILEDALLGRLAHQIHERTTDARDLIAAMNREMRSRKMSSGATVGIGWELADGVSPEQRAVSRLLDREAAQLSTEELARMRAHFAAQIKNLRAARPDRPYSEILGDALDYRQSRTFILTLVAPDGREDRLTQARHGTLSGGEQSVSLHLPLFAAAAFACQLPNDLVFVVPCTTTDRGLPFQPRVSSLKRPTFALCDQLKSVSRARLRRRHSDKLTVEDITAIKFVLRRMIDTY